MLGQGDLEKKITSEEDENFLEVQQVYKQIDRLRDKMKAQTILTQNLQATVLNQLAKRKKLFCQKRDTGLLENYTIQ